MSLIDALNDWTLEDIVRKVIQKKQIESRASKDECASVIVECRRKFRAIIEPTDKDWFDIAAAGIEMLEQKHQPPRAM